MARERITGGISGKNSKNINPVYREMIKKKLSEAGMSPIITKKDISDALQSKGQITLKQFEKQIRKNPNK